uniref:Putative rte ele1 orf1-h 1e-60-j 4 n=1 Tax=Amblyomma cajennense TaxID=34607 RepID=A0A023FRD6_AMBCJ
MTLNATKCKYMQVSRKRTNIDYTYSLSSTILTKAESYRYLGIHITSNLTWSEHITKIAADASKTLGFIRRHLSFSPSSIRSLAYKTFVRSKLEFASPIWNPHQAYLIASLEVVQNHVARFIPKTMTSALALPNKLSADIEPLAHRHKIARLSLLHKLYYCFPSLRDSLPSEHHAVFSTP